MNALKDLEASSIDALITDPPYGLSDARPEHIREALDLWLSGKEHRPLGRGIAGAKWDSFVPSPHLWGEVFRVMKEGAHGLVFAGSRTQDLMGISLRLAGFEVKDCLMWIYGSGFPKSINISKEIDKIGGSRKTPAFRRDLKKARLKRGLTMKQADDLFCGGTTLYSWFEGRPRGFRLPNDKTMLKICEEWPEMEEYREEFKAAEREKIGEYGITIGGMDGKRWTEKGDITASFTEAAKEWEGWGTALKPAYEPILLIKKPLLSTIAESVLERGTGGLNIDSCRIKNEKDENVERWPSNVLFNEKATVELEQNHAKAARYFYTAKPSPRERHAGLSEKGNKHPTVKPLNLMRYLCRLITPPHGVVLDPFTGSGSTLCAAALEGFSFIGIEREAHFCEIARARVKYWEGLEEKEPAQLDLFL